MFLGNLIHHVLDTEGLGVQGLGVPTDLDGLNVHDESVDRNGGNVVRVVDGRGMPLEPMGPPLDSESVVQFVGIREAPARNVPGLAVRAPRASLEFVKVRVVDVSALDNHGVPVEGGVAVRAPHLGAPRNLENHRPAVGARLGVLFEERNRLDRPGIAGVFHVRLFNLVAVRTHGVVAELALPPGRQEPLAVFKGALADKDALGSVGFRARLTVRDDPALFLEVEEPDLGPADPGNLLDDELVVGADLLDAGHGGNRPGHEALFALKEHHFPVLLVGPVAKRRGAGVVDDVAGPRLAAVHAVGVGGQREQKLLGAAATRTEIAKGTHDPFAI